MADQPVTDPAELSKSVSVPHAAPGKALSDAARRALVEAEARRLADTTAAEPVPEQGGPKGVEPTRFGDWERKGLAVDF